MSELFEHFDLWLVLAIPWMHAFALALARIGGVFMALPQFAARGVPKEVKMVVMVAISAALVFGRPLPRISTDALEITFVVNLAAEFGFGLALGFIIHVGIAAVRTAGQIAGIEMGLSFAAVADPLSQSSGTVLSSLFGQFAIQLFLIFGLDRVIIRSLAASTAVHPLGEVSISKDILADMLLLGDSLFRTGVTLALPLMGSIFALKLSMGLLARVAPKIQIFSLTFILTLLLGHIMLALLFPSIGAAIASHLETIAELFRALATAPRNV